MYYVCRPIVYLGVTAWGLTTVPVGLRPTSNSYNARACCAQGARERFFFWGGGGGGGGQKT